MITSFTLLLYLFSLSSVVRSLDPVTATKTKAWADILSLKFADQIDNIMLVPKLQEIYNKIPFTTIQRLGRVEAAASAAQVGALLNDKDHSLRELSSQIHKLKPTDPSFENLFLSLATTITDDLIKQDDTQIMRVYFTPQQNGKTVLHSNNQDFQEVAPTSSTKEYKPIYPPSNVKGKDSEANWMNTDVYDARRTGWYANAVAGSKDVFIIIDESGLNLIQFEQLKKTALYILSTISPNDNIWIERKGATSSNADSSLLTPLSSESCMSGHARGTRQYVKMLSSLITGMQPISSSNSNAVDWKNMLGTAFNSIDVARKKLSNSERVGAFLILSSGNIENEKIQNVIVPYVLSNNTHQLPIMTYHFNEYGNENGNGNENENGNDGSSSLPYSCTALGTSAWLTSISHVKDAGLYYAGLSTRPADDSPVRLSSTSSLHFWGKFYFLSCFFLLLFFYFIQFSVCRIVSYMFVFVFH